MTGQHGVGAQNLGSNRPGLLSTFTSAIQVCISALSNWNTEELLQAVGAYERELRKAGESPETITFATSHNQRFVEWLDASFRRRRKVPLVTAGTRGSKYDPLCNYLRQRDEATVKMTFSEVEAILGVPLPRSARLDRYWWANRLSDMLPQVRAWLRAGREARNVDVTKETVEFVWANAAEQADEAPPGS